MKSVCHLFFTLLSDNEASTSAATTGRLAAVSVPALATGTATTTSDREAEETKKFTFIRIPATSSTTATTTEIADTEVVRVNEPDQIKNASTTMVTILVQKKPETEEETKGRKRRRS